MITGNIMDYNYQILGSPQGPWSLEFNQDFCQGAKELNSLHPAASTPANISNIKNDGNLDEWMEIRDTLGFDGLEAFNDVLLPGEQEFNPIDIFEKFNDPLFLDGIQSPATDSGYMVSDFDVKHTKPNTTYESLTYPQIDECKGPKVTIKLKRITVPKKSIKKKHPHEAPSLSYSQGTASQFAYSKIDELLNDMEFDDAPILNQNELDNESTSKGLTLKDALNMENADLILDNYLSPNHNDFFQDLNPDQWNIVPSSDDDSFSSSGSSVHSPASHGGMLSPYNNSEDYSISSDSFMTSLVTEEEHLDSTLEVHGTSNRKAKKPRPKMSPESRYLRKKEQNKQAALRYRAKKKQEDEQLQGVYDEEQKKKTKLTKQYSTLKQELQLMKKLMRETLIAKRLVHPDAFN